MLGSKYVWLNKTKECTGMHSIWSSPTGSSRKINNDTPLKLRHIWLKKNPFYHWRVRSYCLKGKKESSQHNTRKAAQSIRTSHVGLGPSTFFSFLFLLYFVAFLVWWPARPSTSRLLLFWTAYFTRCSPPSLTKPDLDLCLSGFSFFLCRIIFCFIFNYFSYYYLIP